MRHRRLYGDSRHGIEGPPRMDWPHNPEPTKPGTEMRVRVMNSETGVLEMKTVIAE